MTFKTAITKMQNGYKITHKNWLDGDFIFIKDNILFCDGYFPFLHKIRNKELKSNNWLLYKEK